MKLIISYLIIIGCCALVISCMPDPVSDLKPALDPSQLQYSVTQDPNYDNKIFLESLTPEVIPFWDYEIGTSNKFKDTLILPFKGEFWIKYRAMSQGGSSTDSAMVTVSQFDPTFFADPAWEKLTNGEFGRTWKLVAVKAGDAKSTSYNDWGDASWISSSFGDSVHFNLDKGFNFRRYTGGVPTNASFGLETNEVIPGAYLDTPGKALIIKGDVKMPSDDAGEMAGENKNRFRIFKLSDDTLILGQGAYYTESRKSEGFTYWQWYIRTQ